MDKKQVRQAEEAVSVLKNQSLRFVFRFLDMICFEFGDIIIKKAFGRNEEKKPMFVDTEAGKYALHIQTFFRLSCGSELLLAGGDKFQPNSKLAADENYDSAGFDWSIDGNNRFDEVAKEIFPQPCNLVVSDVSVSKLGDLKLSFTNGFVLEVLVDVSGTAECWRFFESQTEKHLVVTGQGIEPEAEESAAP